MSERDCRCQTRATHAMRTVGLLGLWLLLTVSGTEAASTLRGLQHLHYKFIETGAHGDSRHAHTGNASESSSDHTVRWELVIARFNEPLDWLQHVPAFWHVTIYNKGGSGNPMPQLPQNRPERDYRVEELPNVGREAHTFAYHLTARYDSLADYTVFLQGDPSVHNSHFLELLQHPAVLGPVQPLSRVYMTEGREWSNTPLDMVNAVSTHPWYRAERFSLRTMDSVYFHDKGALGIGEEYRKVYGLPSGTNLIRHQLNLVGATDWILEQAEVGSFSYGAQLGFEKSRALRHPKAVYENLKKTAQEHHVNAWLIERCWLMLFNPVYTDQ